MNYWPIALYAHFLDRELRESVRFKGGTPELQHYLSIGCLFTPTRLYCSYSHLWESGIVQDQQLELIKPVLETDLLYPISDYNSGYEFLESRRPLYEHDRDRYPLYFDKRQEGIIQGVDPKLRAAGKTTLILHQHLQNWSDAVGSMGSSIEVRAANLVRNALRARDDQAITYSYFKSIDSSDSAALDAIRREISKAYVLRYLDTCHGDILTGISNLEFYDDLSVNFPVYDLILIRSLLGTTFESINQFGSIGTLKKIAAFRKSQKEDQLSGLWSALATKLLSSLKPSERLLPKILHRDMLRKRLLGLSHGITPFRQFDGALLVDRILRYGSLVESTFGYHSPLNAPGTKFVVMVATETEQENLLLILKRTNDVRAVSGQAFALWHARLDGGAELYVVRTAMGQLGMGGSILTAINAIDALKPDFFLMPGICMGFKKEGVSMCDNVVAERLTDAASGKIGPTGIEHRGSELPGDLRLLAAARQAEGGVKAHFGLMLSDTNVVNNRDEARRLEQQYPRAIGLEMEGHGVASACLSRKVPFLLTKAICDWGFDKDDANQAIASVNSVTYVFEIVKLLAKPSGFLNL